MSAAKQLEHVQHQVQLLELKRIHESPFNPRKTFDEKAMAELAADVGVHGVMQPILTRPLPAAKGTGIERYEVIFGARRLRAAKLAKLENIPAFVVAMSDADALERMIVENCQREDVDALEEADGYRRLHTEHGFTADQIAGKVGKSRSFVYGRMKLCELTPKARKVVEDKQLGAERALLVARIPDPARQLEAVTQIAFNGTWQHADAVPMSFRKASEWVREHFMLKLSGAPFDTKDAALVAKAGPCTTCPFRTKNAEELFDDIGKADLCTKPTCFNEKKAASWANERKDAKESGLKVLSEAESKQVLHGHGSYATGQVARSNAAYVALNDTCMADPKRRTWKQLAGKEAPKPSVVARNEKGDVVKLVPREELEKVLEDRGHKLQKAAPAGNGPGKAHWEKQQEREEKERAERLAVAYRVMGKAIEKVEAGEGGKAFLRLQVDELLENIDYELLERRWGEVDSDKDVRDRVDKMSEAQLRGFAFELVMGPAVYSTWNNQGALKSVSELYGLDAGAERDALKAEQREAKKQADQEARELDGGAAEERKAAKAKVQTSGHAKAGPKKASKKEPPKAAELPRLVAGVCVGCGCTDDRACPLQPDGTTCSWLNMDRTHCSACFEVDAKDKLVPKKKAAPAPPKKRRMAIQDEDTAAERPDPTGGEARS